MGAVCSKNAQINPSTQPGKRTDPTDLNKRVKQKKGVKCFFQTGPSETKNQYQQKFRERIRQIPSLFYVKY